MPPMVNFGFRTENGCVTDEHVKHYTARAKGGVGLIIIEATCVNPQGRLSASQLGLWSDDQIAGFSKIAEACHNQGAAVLVQIHHAGLAAAPGVTSEPTGTISIFRPVPFWRHSYLRQSSHPE